MQHHRFPRTFVVTGRCSPASRVGVTLTEVLISLLVISVSVVSVATLFPLSLLRSVQARQLTQATILRYNAENLIDLQPNMFSRINDNGNFENIQRGEYVVIDPLGWHLMWETDVQNNTNLRDWFGGLRRFNSGLRDQTNPQDILSIENQNFLNLARNLVSLPDSWINVTEGVAENNTLTSVRLTKEFDFKELIQGVAYRITLFDITERFSYVRSITSIDPPVLGWEDIPLDLDLPPGFVVGRVKIAVQEQRYTWLLTLRSSVRSADVVVFFRRSFSEEDEQIHTASFFPISPGLDGQPGVAGKDDDNKNGTDDPGELGWPNTDDHPNRRVFIEWTGGLDNKPFMRRNGFIFDVHNALWYRIHRIENETASSAELVLDDVIKAKGTRGALLMRGVVEVYPIAF